MKTILYTIIVSMIGLALLPMIASASTTGPWEWQDISSIVDHRNNRPIWAMAQADDGFFYTDGLDLSNGGQVYRFDGVRVYNLTDAVRNAGLSRADDIVSDRAGQVLFLQDVVRMDNHAKVVLYNHGAYSNRTNFIQGLLALDEAVSSINGYQGVWMLITTKGRVFQLSNNLTQAQRVTLPVTTSIDPNRLRYTTVHSDQMPLYAVPVNNAWLFSIETEKQELPISGHTVYQFYIYRNGQFSKTYPETDICGPGMNCTALGSMQLMQSDGKTALVMYHLGGSHYSFGVYRFFNGTSWSDRTMFRSAWSQDLWEALPWKNVIAAANGSSWIAIGDKKLVRLTDGNIEELGETRDLFVTLAGDYSGHFLLGGAVSEMGNPNPTNPITAKLALVTENGFPKLAISNQTNQNTVSNPPSVSFDAGNGISRWDWLNPEITSFGNNQNTTYFAGAEDADGIARIEIVVNGQYVQTCHFANAKGNQDCSYVIYANQYPINTNVFVNAKVTDGKGNVTWTNGKNIWRNAAEQTNSTNYIPNNSTVTNGQVYAWNWFSNPIKNDLVSSLFSTGANAENGLDRMEIYINGDLKNTCSLGGARGDQFCYYTVHELNYQLGSTVTGQVRAIDVNGRETWSDATSIVLELADNSSSSNTQNTSIQDTGAPSAWQWLDPNTNIITDFEVVKYHVGASDENGIADMTFYVNGEPQFTCHFTGGTEDRECWVELKGINYENNQMLFVNAQVHDLSGRETWTDGMNVTVKRTQ